MPRDRIYEWELFSEKVRKHIVDYAEVQYGRKEGNEQIDKMSYLECVRAIEKYCARAGNNVRGPEEDLRDLLKISHWAQFAYDKLRKERCV
jgi:hypothetical protein